jgi:hypothetical protein
MKKILFCLFISFSLSACQVHRDTSEPMDAGFLKIDREDYDGAIAYFEDLISKDPRPQVRIALATAYAGRAGLKVESFWDFAKAMRQEPVTKESLVQHPFYIRNKQNIADLEPLLSEQTRNDLSTLFEMMSALDIYRGRIETVPYVQRSRRPDVEKAIQILNDIPDPGGRVYRAVLSGTYLRSELEDGFDIWGTIEARINEAFRNPIESISIFCTPVTGNFAVWLGQKFYYIESTARDLAVAFPSDAPTFIAFEAPVSSLQERLPQLQSTLVPGACNE